MLQKYMVSNELKALSKQHPIILFDGECVMCNGFIQWLIKRDNNQIFRYATLQSQSDLSDFDSVILVDDEHVFTKSDVSIQVLKKLALPWSLLSCLVIVPTVIRDKAYDIIARNRYRWFGKKDQCYIPTQEEQSLFIDV